MKIYTPERVEDRETREIPSPLQSFMDETVEYQTATLSDLKVTDDGYLSIDGRELSLTAHSMNQLATFAGLPAAWARKAPAELIADNFNYSFKHGTGERKFSIVDGTYVRGLYDIDFEPVSPREFIDRFEGIDVYNWRVDPTGIEAWVTSPEWVDVKPNDPNTAMGAINLKWTSDEFFIKTGLYRMICTNGAVSQTLSVSRQQFGKHRWSYADQRLNFVFDEGFMKSLDDANDLLQRLPALTTMPMNLHVPVGADDDEADLIKFGVARGMKETKIPAKHLDLIMEAARPEDDSVYGFYNTLTRLGRDSAVTKVQSKFEAGGYLAVKNAENIVRAISTN